MTKKIELHKTDATPPDDTDFGIANLTHENHPQTLEVILASETSADPLSFMFNKSSTIATPTPAEEPTDIDIILHKHDARGILNQYYVPPTDTITCEPIIISADQVEDANEEANVLYDLGIESKRQQRKKEK